MVFLVVSLKQYYSDDFKCPHCKSGKVKSVNAIIKRFVKGSNTIVTVKCPDCCKEIKIEVIG